jgi:thioredoxin-like negative regulator of GroEL
MSQQIAELLAMIPEEQLEAFLQSLPAQQAEIIKRGVAQAATAGDIQQAGQILAEAVWNFLDVPAA